MSRATKEEQARLCAAWRASGLGCKAFCEQQNINIKNLYRWLHKEKQAKITSTNPLKFIPVQKAINSCTSYVEVNLPNGIFLKARLEAGNIAGLIKELL